MKNVLVWTVLGLALSASSAFANDEKPVKHNRMAECHQEAGDKKGEERKAFMKTCLSNKKAEHQTAKTMQQEKMKTCNAEAKGLKGEERKAKMSACLKG